MLSATNLHWSFSSPSPPQLLVRGTFLFSLPSFTPSSTSPVANTSPLSFLHSASTLTHIPAPKEITTFRHTRPFSSISPVPSLYRNLLTAKSSRASKLQVSHGLAAHIRYNKYLIRLLSFYLGVLRWQWSWSPGSTALPSCSYQWLEDPHVELTSLQLPGQGLKPSTTATEFLQSAKKEAANSSEKERGFADFGTMNGIFLKQTFF